MTRSILWILLISVLPILFNLLASPYIGLPLEGAFACQAGATIVALLLWLPFMRSLRDPADGPVPQLTTTEQLRILQKQDLAVLFLAMAPIGLMALVAVTRS